MTMKKRGQYLTEEGNKETNPVPQTSSRRICQFQMKWSKDKTGTDREPKIDKLYPRMRVSKGNWP